MRSRAGALTLTSLAALTLGCSSPEEPADAEPGAQVLEPAPESKTEALVAELEAFENRARSTTDFARYPASDGRFGADPQRIVAVPGAAEGPRFVVLERGADLVRVLDGSGRSLSAAPAPHQGVDLAWVGDELWAVGLGAAQVARYALDGVELEALEAIALPEGASPRGISALAEGGGVLVIDEGTHVLHRVSPVPERAPEGAPGWLVTTQALCRGPLQIQVWEERSLVNCLFEHTLLVDSWVEGRRSSVAKVVHDGPIWAFASAGEVGGDADTLALVGVEDHPLERSDGGFNYIDSFLFVVSAASVAEGTEVAEGAERRAAINLSELGLVTPKWVRWLSPTRLAVTGYASAQWLELEWSDTDFEGEPSVTRRPWLPGTTDAAPMLDKEGELAGWLSTNALFDGVLRVEAGWSAEPELLTYGPDEGAAGGDERSFDERLGELLVFTTAMAPSNGAEGKRSRFTCETCHFEGRGDGRVHFTGREREGQRVHARSKTLLGLSPNRPHFSRALDRSMARMVDNEFGVANRFGEDEDLRDGSFTLDASRVPWLARVPGWPGAVEAPELRRALMRFLMRFSMVQNPRARGREAYSALEAEGAERFAERCEGCHEARLVTDDPSSRQPSEAWEGLIFSASGPLVWARETYAKTQIQPYVHDEGARVPSLRRLNLVWPYFTTGEAASLEAVLEGVRLTTPTTGEAGVDHALGPAGVGEVGLGAEERRALAAFLRLL